MNTLKSFGVIYKYLFELVIVELIPQLSKYVCIVAYKNPKTNQIEVIDDPMKHVKSIPSVISCSDNEFKFSFDAINTKRGKPGSCLYDAKRFIGRTFNNVSKNFVIKKMNFELEKVNDKPTFKVNYRDNTVNLFPEQVIALLLRHLKTIAEDFFGKKIEGFSIEGKNRIAKQHIQI